ncbi:MAG: 2-C-methyl-D-erythritol 2,4-cyclodiphosphate synthase [Simkaniaceae bacterium]|nr:2-C-methyl-D-erythritol 2,4-cyclodiphosphate synthase [Simkaniaceae bacterium]
MKYAVGIGQDSHRFAEQGGQCVMGGVVFPGVPAMEANSDGDVVLHAICNAITCISHVPILGGLAIDMCNRGITDSSKYLEAAIDTLGGWKIAHISLTVEGKRPRMQKLVDAVRESVAKLCAIDITQVGMTVTSGDHLSDFARGDGLQCFAIVTFNGE